MDIFDKSGWVVDNTQKQMNKIKIDFKNRDLIDQDQALNVINL